MSEQVRKTARRAVVTAVAPLLGCHAALLAVFDLGAHPWLFLGIEATAFGALGFAHRRLRGLRWGATTLVVVGALLRGILLPLPLALSDDAYRYLWDGRLVLAGHDPYALAPEADELLPLRDELWQRVAHRDVPTVYPPAALGLFSIAAATPSPLYALKVSLVLCDLAGGLLLLQLATRRGVPRERVLWYAWNPLLVLEGAGMAHVDVAGAAAAIAAVAWLTSGGDARRRARTSGLAGAAAAAGVLVKLIPVIALPAWLRFARHRAAFASVAVLLTGLGLLPMAASSGGVPPGLVRYGVSWEFNGPVFEPLWRVIDAGEVAPRLKGLLDRAKEVSQRRGSDGERWNAVYPYVYPQLLAKVVLTALLVGAVVFALRAGDPIAATLRAFGAAFLLNATAYPWYAVWTLPWAALGGAWPWHVLSFTLLFSYLPRVLGVESFPLVYLMVWAPFAAAAAIWALRRKNAAPKAAVRRHESPP